MPSQWEVITIPDEVSRSKLNSRRAFKPLIRRSNDAYSVVNYTIEPPMEAYARQRMHSMNSLGYSDPSMLLTDSEAYALQQEMAPTFPAPRLPTINICLDLSSLSNVRNMKNKRSGRHINLPSSRSAHRSHYNDNNEIINNKNKETLRDSNEMTNSVGLTSTTTPTPTTTTKTQNSNKNKNMRDKAAPCTSTNAAQDTSQSNSNLENQPSQQTQLVLSSSQKAQKSERALPTEIPSQSHRPRRSSAPKHLFQPAQATFANDELFITINAIPEQQQQRSPAAKRSPSTRRSRSRASTPRISSEEPKHALQTCNNNTEERSASQRSSARRRSASQPNTRFLPARENNNNKPNEEEQKEEIHKEEEEDEDVTRIFYTNDNAPNMEKNKISNNNNNNNNNMGKLNGNITPPLSSTNSIPSSNTAKSNKDAIQALKNDNTAGTVTVLTNYETVKRKSTPRSASASSSTPRHRKSPSLHNNNNANNRSSSSYEGQISHRRSKRNHRHAPVIAYDYHDTRYNPSTSGKKGNKKRYYYNNNNDGDSSRMPQYNSMVNSRQGTPRRATEVAVQTDNEKLVSTLQPAYVPEYPIMTSPLLYPPAPHAVTGLTRAEVCTPIIQYTQNSLQETTPTRVITYVITPHTPTIQTPRVTDNYYSNNNNYNNNYNSAMVQTMTPRTPRTPQLTIQNNSQVANQSSQLPSSMSLSSNNNTTSNSNNNIVNNNAIVSANRYNVNNTNVPYTSATEITPTVPRPQPLFSQEVKPKINTMPQNMTSTITNNNNNNNNTTNNNIGNNNNNNIGTNINPMTSTENVLPNNKGNLAQKMNTNVNNYINTNTNNIVSASTASRAVASPITTSNNIYNNNVNTISNMNNIPNYTNQVNAVQQKVTNGVNGINNINNNVSQTVTRAIKTDGDMSTTSAAAVATEAAAQADKAMNSKTNNNLSNMINNNNNNNTITNNIINKTTSTSTNAAASTTTSTTTNVANKNILANSNPNNNNATNTSATTTTTVTTAKKDDINNLSKSKKDGEKVVEVKKTVTEEKTNKVGDSGKPDNKNDVKEKEKKKDPEDEFEDYGGKPFVQTLYQDECGQEVRYEQRVVKNKNEKKILIKEKNELLDVRNYPEQPYEGEWYEKRTYIQEPVIPLSSQECETPRPQLIPTVPPPVAHEDKHRVPYKTRFRGSHWHHILHDKESEIRVALIRDIEEATGIADVDVDEVVLSMKDVMVADFVIYHTTCDRAELSEMYKRIKQYNFPHVCQIYIDELRALRHEPNRDCNAACTLLSSNNCDNNNNNCNNTCVNTLPSQLYECNPPPTCESCQPVEQTRV